MSCSLRQQASFVQWNSGDTLRWCKALCSSNVSYICPLSRTIWQFHTGTMRSHTQCNVWIHTVVRMPSINFFCNRYCHLHENLTKTTKRYLPEKIFKCGLFSVCSLSIYRDRFWSEVFYSAELLLCVNGTSRPSTEYHHHHHFIRQCSCIIDTLSFSSAE